MKRIFVRSYISLFLFGLVSLFIGHAAAAEVTLTLKASQFGTLNLSYEKAGKTVKENTKNGDLRVVLEENTLVTLTVASVSTGKKFVSFKGLDPSKIEKKPKDQYLVKADVTLEAEFADLYVLTIKKTNGPDIAPMVQVNGADVVENYRRLESGNIITFKQLIGYTYTIDKFEGVEKTGENEYKVTGNATFDITFTELEGQWFPLTFNQSPLPSGNVEIKWPYAQEKLSPGDRVPMGLTLRCVVSKIPLGYDYAVDFVGLTKKSEKNTTDPTTGLRKYEYELEVSATPTIGVTLTKKDNEWHTVTFSATGQDANNKGYKLAVYSIDAESGLHIPITSGETQLPEGARFFCDFETAEGAYPTVECTNATALPANSTLSPFIYTLTGDAVLSISAWETKTVKVTYSAKPATLGTIRVYYRQDDTEKEVENNALVPWGTHCFVEVKPKEGAELKEQKMQGFALVKDNQYKLIAEVAINVTFEQSSYHLQFPNYEGIEISAMKGATSIDAATILHYDDEIEIVVNNKAPQAQWVKESKLTNLEATTTPNTYKVKGNATIVLELVKLYALQLKGTPQAQYEVTYTSAEAEKTEVVNGADATIYANENTEVVLVLTPKSEGYVLKEVHPLEVKALTGNKYSFTVTQNTEVAFVYEPIVKAALTIKCHENGAILVAYGKEEERIAGEKTLQLEQGIKVTLRALPNEHFRVASFKVGDNVAFREEGSFILKEPTAVELSFEAKTFPVSSISYRGLGQLVLTTLDRATNVDLKQGDLVTEGEKIKITYIPDKEFTAVKESLQVLGLVAEGDAYVVTGAVIVSIDFAPNAEPSAVKDAYFASVVVAPNPFVNQLRITNSELQTGEYALLNAQGIIVAAGVLEQGETLINTESVRAGIYLLRLTNRDGATKVYRLIKE